MTLIYTDQRKFNSKIFVNPSDSCSSVECLPTALLYDRRGVLRWKIISFEYTIVIETEVKGLL